MALNSRLAELRRMLTGGMESLPATNLNNSLGGKIDPATLAWLGTQMPNAGGPSFVDPPKSVTPAPVSPAPVAPPPVAPKPPASVAPVPPTPVQAPAPMAPPPQVRPGNLGPIAPYIPATPESRVTAPTVLPTGEPGPTVSLEGPNQRNLNYGPDQSRATQFVQGAGGTVHSQPFDNTPVGNISQPLQSATFGENNLDTEVNMPLQQIQFWLDRGDPMWIIRMRLGLDPGPDAPPNAEMYGRF